MLENLELPYESHCNIGVLVSLKFLRRLAFPIAYVDDSHEEVKSRLQQLLPNCGIYIFALPMPS
jgi:hypothetical protein